MSVLLNGRWNDVQAEQWGDGEVLDIFTTRIFATNIFAMSTFAVQWIGYKAISQRWNNWLIVWFSFDNLLYLS